MEQDRKKNTERGHYFLILTIKDLKIILVLMMMSHETLVVSSFLCSISFSQGFGHTDHSATSVALSPLL